MAILVIGGAGYIGSATVEHLIEQGEDVVVLDNLSLGHRAAVHPQATLVVGEMGDAETLRQIFRGHEIEAIFHFAALALVGESMEHPLRYWRNNVEACITLAGCMVEAGVDKFVFSSTCATYGEPERLPMTEDLPQRPVNTYGFTKLAFERLLGDIDRAHGVRNVCLRYFNACGATEERGEDHTPETHLIPLVLQVALDQREKILIFGDDYPTRDGTCVRDYIHILDLAQAHRLALDHLRAGKPSAAYNLGNGEGFTVKEIVEIAREITGHSIPTEMAPRREGDPASLISSSTRAQQELGWKPELSDIREIIESAWKWHRGHPQGYVDRAP